MLSRASKLKAQHEFTQVCQSSLRGLTFLWLCPILWRASPPRRKVSTITSTRSLRRPKFTQPSTPKTDPTKTRITHRDLASAANASFAYDEHDVLNTRDNFVPFEVSQTEQQRHAVKDYRWPGLNDSPANPAVPRSSPLIIREISSTRPPQFRSVDGISGDLPEIMQTLRACFKIGRFTRAAALMRRLNEIYRPDTPQLLATHNEYLGELVDRIVYTKDQQMIRELHKWFEVHLRGVGIIPDATTYALMIKATLQEFNPKKMDRTIRRYLSLADAAGIRDRTKEIMLLILNEQDIGRATQFDPLPSLEEVVPDASERPTLLQIQPSITAPIDDALTIKSTPQKGLGLGTLKNALSMFSDPQSHPNNAVNKEAEEKEQESLRFQRQRRLERDTYESAINRWRKEAKVLQSLGVDPGLKSIPMGAMMFKWHENLVPRIEEEIRRCNDAEEKQTKSSADKERCLYGPFLQILPADKLATITILSNLTNLCRKGAHEKGVTLTSSVLAVGQAVEEESLAEIIKKDRQYKKWRNINIPEKLRKLTRLLKSKQAKDSLTLVTKLNAQEREDTVWTQTIRVRVGAVLTSLLLDIAKMHVMGIDPKSGVRVVESQPVFFHSFQHYRGKVLGTIRFNKAMIAKLSCEPVHCTLEKRLPMLVEPKPWVDFYSGGFLEHRVQFVRNKSFDLELLRYVTTATSNGDMSQLFAGLDSLARTPWRINRKVFETMVAGWNSGEKLGKIPPEELSAESPEEPPVSADISIRLKWMNQMKEIEVKRASIRSQRCFLNFQLEVARAYVSETMYFPHNMDFRGRAYPMVPFLNHMNADPCRSLLIFAEGKELGESGLKWLKIHLASLYGYDKASFEERHIFADDHLSEIHDSATNPLGGNRWWLQADDPWQCLSACFELTSALATPDPRKFISHLPIHKDGTCNGLQHYAALGGDSLGAKQVNLEPGSRPSDIYSRVASLVEAKVAQDAADGHEIARLLTGNISRKVVKQTVMTHVYGVTFSGAKDQVRRQLEEKLPDLPNTGDTSKFRASSYIAKEIFRALTTMFTRAQEIQYWLGDCARRISRCVTPEQIEGIRKQKIERRSPYAKVVLGKKTRPTRAKERDLFKSTVIWTTPLNMPVVQPYRQSTTKHLFTNLQKINIDMPTTMGPTNMRKQLQAFPPNFIHSLDATHMILTALQCKENGLTFAAVHDSFWTHASDVDVMNNIIRDAFIRMHSDDIIGRLRSEFVTRHKGCLHLVPVKPGSILGQKLKEWREKTSDKRSQRKIAELLMEYRRQELLSSDNPEERREGESMRTGATIYEEFANETNVIATDDLDTYRIGKVPDLIPEIHEAAELQTPVDSNFDAAFAAESEVKTGDALDNEEATKEPGASKPKSWVWLPISFPPVPQKGDFDISKIKTSSYFFS